VRHYRRGHGSCENGIRVVNVFAVILRSNHAFRRGRKNNEPSPPLVLFLFKYVPVASVGVNNWNQFCITDVSASIPTSVAHVTNHRTISRLRQFNEANVMRITFFVSGYTVTLFIIREYSRDGKLGWADRRRTTDGGRYVLVVRVRRRRSTAEDVWVRFRA